MSHVPRPCYPSILLAPRGADPNNAFDEQIANKLIKSITDENDAIDLDQLETDLETQDRTSSLFYGDDDLSHDEVVAVASETN